MKPGLACVAIALSSITTCVAHAQDAAARESAAHQLASLRELVTYASYRAAVPAALALLERSDLVAQDRNAALELLAIVHLAMRDERSARDVLARLYARDPGHRPSDAEASPMVQTAFARARERAQPITVAVEHEPPQLRRRASPLIQVHIAEGADAVHEVRLAYREAEAARWTTIILPLEGPEATGAIPLAALGDMSYTVEYYLEATAPSGTVLGRSGSPNAPLTLEVPPIVAQDDRAEVSRSDRSIVDPEGTTPSDHRGGDITGEAWLWVVIGVAVVGAGVAIGVGVHLASQGPSSGSLGDVTLPLIAF
jgi:hypothetical protein